MERPLVLLALLLLLLIHGDGASMTSMIHLQASYVVGWMIDGMGSPKPGITTREPLFSLSVILE